MICSGDAPIFWAMDCLASSSSERANLPGREVDIAWPWPPVDWLKERKASRAFGCTGRWALASKKMGI